MPESPSTRDDHQDDGLSVVFSAAPDPAADTTPPVAPEPSGWPWFLPQDGLRQEDLEQAVDIDEDPTAAAAAMARIPLVRGATTLLEHVGDGLPLTDEGELPTADVRVLAESLDLDLDGQSPGGMREVGGIVGPWNALLAGNWLNTDGVGVVPGEGMVPAASQAEDPAGYVRFAHALLVLLVLESLRQGPEEGGLFGGPDTFTALLHTVAPEGLELPASVRVAIDRGLVPVDPGGDPDMDEINRYWQVERDLGTLADYGLLRREIAEDGQDIRYRGTAEVLLEAYGALEMHQELG